MKKHNDTKYESFEKMLSAVGKAVFVMFYYDFKDSTISKNDLAQKIYTESPNAKSLNQNYRIARARRIFAEGQAIKVLENIIESVGVDEETKKKAKIILEQEKNTVKHNEEITEEEQFNEDLHNEVIYSPVISFEYDNKPASPKHVSVVKSTRYFRSKNVAKNALFKANYRCETDVKHLLFKRKNSNLYYTEPHHLVPLFVADQFPGIDLDREQNVVSLCAFCHKWLHYGNNIDSILRPLYESRKDLLKAIGIDITYVELKKFYE